jgi:hypothetical protein
MLTAGPSCCPAALAYSIAFAFASATALARADASSAPVSLRFSDTPSTVVALPPARAAAWSARPRAAGYSAWR